MFADFGFETLTAPQAAVWFGVLIGLAFGALAQVTQFCLRRAVVTADAPQARGIWAMALAIAVLGTQSAVAAGWIGFGDHRFFASDLPWLAIVTGGLMFGAGMVLTRGCASRLTVLAGSGNLRAVLVLVVFAITAHAALKGVLAPLRTGLGAVTAPLPALPGQPLIWAGVIAAVALWIALRSGNRAGPLALAALLGALVPLAWVGTGFGLLDEFDPVPLESLSFTLPAAESLFWLIASSSIPATFDVGLLGGTLAGAAVMALARREFVWQSFDSPGQTARYMAGAALMGVGGTLAGGCTVGAGLSGIPTLSLAAVLAFAAIIAGALAMARISADVRGSAAQPTTPRPQPAA